MNKSMNLNINEVIKLVEIYKKYIDNTPEKYIKCKFKYNGSIVKIYTTNKLLIQGKNVESTFDEISIKLNRINTINEDNKTKVLDGNIIGTDEVGTGDVFGGIFVCACYVNTKQIPELESLGLKDSKKYKDSDILELAPQLKQKLSHTVIYLDNNKYNNTLNNYNLNKIKALMHNDAILKITKNITNYDYVIIDGFTSKSNYLKYLEDNNPFINVYLIEKAEDQYLAVAAASIIARYHLILNFVELSKEYNYNFPKGAGKQVNQMINRIHQDNNEHILNNVAKLNFKNFK